MRNFGKTALENSTQYDPLHAENLHTDNLIDILTFEMDLKTKELGSLCGSSFSVGANHWRRVKNNLSTAGVVPTSPEVTRDHAETTSEIAKAQQNLFVLI